jgi:pimeloyl-ACP methyl ester carboxylesterase
MLTVSTDLMNAREEPGGEGGSRRGAGWVIAGPGKTTRHLLVRGVTPRTGLPRHLPKNSRDGRSTAGRGDELLAHQILGAASCDAVPLIEYAIREGYSLEAERITCPVRIVWGTDDKLLSWPSTAARFLNDWLPHADWVELEGIGHCPQLDIPLEAAQLILGFTAANGFSAIDLHRQSRV